MSTHWYDEMPHAFMQLPAPEADDAIAVACTFLRRVLGEGPRDRRLSEP